MIEGWFRRRYLWYLKRHKVRETHAKRSGGCVRCGACCAGCIFHDNKKFACRIYNHRPAVCRAYPISVDDKKTTPKCGFRFD
jgi:hypothetical protein